MTSLVRTMLTPEYLEQLPESIVVLYAQVEQDILSDMARRISTYDYWIPAAEHQRQKLREMGAVQEEIIARVARLSKRTPDEIKRLMKEAADEALESDREYYRQYGLSVSSDLSDEMKDILNAGYRSTNKLFKNLTKTTASAGQAQFIAALDRAWLQIQSGGFDYNTSIRSAIKGLSKRGVDAIRYPSGHIDTVEVAVRRAVVTGVNQTALQLQWQLADEVGCDLVETTAHAGARPSHAVWQGQVFSRSGKHPKYPDFVQATGYGTGAGLGGWNCRHSFHPYIEGSPLTYSKTDLETYAAKSYRYNGHLMTEYEATQRQRHIERQIRRWKREKAAMSSVGMDIGESTAKIRRWQKTQRDFLRQTGLKRQIDREQIG